MSMTKLTDLILTSGNPNWLRCNLQVINFLTRNKQTNIRILLKVGGQMLFKIKNAWSQAFIIILLTAFILQAVNPCASICASMAEQGYRDISLAEQILLHKAYGLAEKENRAGALKILEEFKENKETKGKKTHALILFTMGNYHLTDKQLKKAAACYKEAVVNTPEFEAAWLNLAQTNYQLNRYVKAGDAFIKGYEYGEAHKPEHLYYSTTAYISAKEYKKALKSFNRLFLYHATEIKLSWQESLVHIYLSLEQPEKALPHMELLAEKSSGKTKIQWQKTLLYQYINLEMNEKALDYLNFLTTHYPEEPQWWKGLVHFYLAQNQYEPALTALTICSFLAPLSENEKKLLADLNLSLGIPARAAKYYKELFKQKHSPALVKNIIHTLRRMNSYEEALDFANQGIEYLKVSSAHNDLNHLNDNDKGKDKDKDKDKNKDLNDLKMIKGEILFSIKKYKKAAAVFENVANAATKNSGRAWLMLGYSAMNSGDRKQARHALEKALTFKKEKKAAERALRF